MARKGNKRKAKVKLPVDCHGTPINIGDWLMFEEGPVHVTSLTLYEDGSWTAGDENDDYACDNLEHATVVNLYDDWRRP